MLETTLRTRQAAGTLLPLPERLCGERRVTRERVCGCRGARSYGEPDANGFVHQDSSVGRQLTAAGIFIGSERAVMRGLALSCVSAGTQAVRDFRITKECQQSTCPSPVGDEHFLAQRQGKHHA